MTPYRKFEITFISMLVVLGEKYKKETNNITLTDYVHFRCLSDAGDRLEISYYLSSTLNSYPQLYKKLRTKIREMSEAEDFGTGFTLIEANQPSHRLRLPGIKKLLGMVRTKER